MTRVMWANLNPEADARGSWDQGVVEELTAGYEPGIPDETVEKSYASADVVRYRLKVPWVDESAGAVVVIAGQHNRWPKFAKPIADLVASLPWALTIVTSDEEALFPVELLPHDNKHQIWGQYHSRPEFDKLLPIGLPPQTRADLNAMPIEAVVGGPTRDLDVFFAGQNTHARREELIATMKAMACESGNGNISWVASTGFRSGLDRGTYLACMARTKIAPCPSGYHSLDSFRLYEAIAAGALPIIETSTPDAPEHGFWPALSGHPPFNPPIPIVDSWDELPSLCARFRDPTVWRHERDKVQGWYVDYRASLAADFKSTIARLQS